MSSHADTPAPPHAPPAAPGTPTFDIADVHPSPHSTDNFMRGGQLRGDRYILRGATMVDLVAKAYNVDPLNGLSGPAWLELDRFDIYAKAPRTTSPDDQRLMLRALLASRFHLVVHTDIKTQPAFVLSVGKGSPKMKPSDSSAGPGGPGSSGDIGDSNCKYNPPPQTNGPPPPAMPISFTCNNQTMADLAAFLHGNAEPYLPRPVVDQTNLKGGWDFDIKWSWEPPKAGADGITIFDAVAKLGLKLESKPAPLPVVFVDSVDQKPTPNSPGLDKALPPPPPPAFDVAVIKPTDPTAPNGMQIMLNGADFNASGLTLQFLLTWAWDVNNQTIAGAPKGLKDAKYDIVAKIAGDPAPGGPNAQPLYDFDDVRQMVRNLVIDRFQLKYYMADQPADAYNLVAANPHMKKADPATRAGCHPGPGPDGKDPRIANPVLSRLITCQNVTMAQFADLIQPMATGYIKFPILDLTGIDGAYDFTLSFSRASADRTAARTPPPSPDGSAAAPDVSDPSGAISLPDAIYKTLGLKLEKVKRPVPMLVIDHIEEKPTDN